MADDASPGEKLLYYRELRGYTREEFGKLVGLEPGGVQNFEAGINQIHYRHALKFADLLGVEPDVFLSDYTRFCAPGYGDRIRRIRCACGQTQQEFAETLGVTRTRVSVWEAEIDEFHPSFQSFEKLGTIASENGIQIKRLIEDPDSCADEYAEFISGEYGKKIKYIRAAYGVTQAEFCRMLGYEGDTSSCLWESKKQKPHRKYFGRIKFLAEAKGISLARLNEDPDFYRDAYSRFIERDSGKKIRYIRLTYGVYTDVFGRMLGCSGNAVAVWERGQYTMGRQYFDALERLAAEKGIFLDALNDDPSLYQDPYDVFCSGNCAWKIHFVRICCEMSIVRFASEIGVSTATVSSWESSSTEKISKRPGRESFRKICDLLSAAGGNLNKIEKDYDCFFRLLKEYRSPGYGRKVKRIREQMGLKRKEFAATVGVGDQTVYHWEKEAESHGSYICPGELTFYRIWKLALKRGVDINES